MQRADVYTRVAETDLNKLRNGDEQEFANLAARISDATYLLGYIRDGKLPEGTGE